MLICFKIKVEFENSIRRLSFLCCLTGIKIGWINPWTRDAFAAAKSCKNLAYQVFDEWVKSRFSTFLSVWADVPWSSKHYHYYGGWLRQERMVVITEWKWINHVLLQKWSVVDFDSEVWEKKSITFSVSERIWLVTRKKSWQFKIIFQPKRHTLQSKSVKQQW